ncbi:hypothetical protein IOK49_04705 [Fervidicoccus fontis]|uniref:polynucleotide 5'-hydroxyl-kinase n=1 Tax=Fervidicoccus fontis TaxID=683846 RepID=A0A843A937_9CREN|nr:Clp1/GlmU family protein [Fervidicoccus fontis]MBE9391373.1 hypothetical protein [Fervidicoccus fontis]
MEKILETNEIEKFYFIKGPAKINVLRGKVEINGILFDKGESVVIHKSRSYILRIEKNSKISVIGENDFCIRDAINEEIEVYTDWKKYSSLIVEECANKEKTCKVIVLGKVDSGKTTFSSMIANTAYLKGMETYYVDTDLGQKTFGYPGSVTISKNSGKLFWSTASKSDKFIFIGKLSPVGKESDVIQATEELIAGIEKGIIIIDTDGWFGDPLSLNYKFRMIQKIKPDYTVIIRSGQKIDLFVKSIFPITKIITLNTPPNKASRSKIERKMIRGDKVLSLIESKKSRLLTYGSFFTLGEITIGFGNLLSYNELTELSNKIGDKVLYGEDYDEKTVIIVERLKRNYFKDFYVINTNNLKGKIVSVLNDKGEHIDIGFLTDINEYGFLIKTSYEKEIKGLYIGNITIFDFKLENSD